MSKVFIVMSGIRGTADFGPVLAYTDPFTASDIVEALNERWENIDTKGVNYWLEEVDLDPDFEGV